MKKNFTIAIKKFQAYEKTKAGEKTGTGIENAEVTIQNSAFIYDLQGRRVENPGKGIYIRGNKKVVL